MQFIPSTWSVVGVDADGDGKRNPQDVDDAALATAVYLCSGDDDLGSTPGQRAAVYRYNHSQSYVDLVLSIMAAYLDGEFTSVPNGVTSAGYVVPQATPTGGAKPHKGNKKHDKGDQPKGDQPTDDESDATTPTPTPTKKPTQQPSSDPTTVPTRGPEAPAADADAAAPAVDLDHRRSTSCSPRSRPGRSACSTATSTTSSRTTTRTTSACTRTPTDRSSLVEEARYAAPVVEEGTPAAPAVEEGALAPVSKPPQRTQRADRGPRVRSGLVADRRYAGYGGLGSTPPPGFPAARPGG